MEKPLPSILLTIEIVRTILFASTQLCALGDHSHAERPTLPPKSVNLGVTLAPVE